MTVEQNQNEILNSIKDEAAVEQDERPITDFDSLVEYERCLGDAVNSGKTYDEAHTLARFLVVGRKGEEAFRNQVLPAEDEPFTQATAKYGLADNQKALARALMAAHGYTPSVACLKALERADQGERRSLRTSVESLPEEEREYFLSLSSDDKRLLSVLQAAHPDRNWTASKLWKQQYPGKEPAYTADRRKAQENELAEMRKQYPQEMKQLERDFATVKAGNPSLKFDDFIADRNRKLSKQIADYQRKISEHEAEREAESIYYARREW